MARITKLLALGGIVAGAVAALRKRRKDGADAPTEAASDEAPSPPAPPAAEPEPERPAGGPVDRLVEEQTAAAAAEARAIGGVGGNPIQDAGGDPALEPVYQAGGGEQEGFEAAEAELIESASHGEGAGGAGGDPIHDAFTPEVESDRSTARYGEPDEEDVSEVVRDVDPATGEPETSDDPGEGPGIATER